MSIELIFNSRDGRQLFNADLREIKGEKYFILSDSNNLVLCGMIELMRVNRTVLVKWLHF